MQVWKNSLKNYKIDVYKHSEHKYYLSSQINSLKREYSFTYKIDEGVFMVKGKEYALTEENRKILLDKIVEFENEWSNAFREYKNVFTRCFDRSKSFVFLEILLFLLPISCKNFFFVR